MKIKIDYWNIFLTKCYSLWWLFAVTTFVSLFFVWLHLRYAQPEYKTIATILQENKSNGSQEILGFNFNGNINLENQIEILQSKSLVTSVVNEKDFDVSYLVKGEIKLIDLYEKSPIKMTKIFVSDSIRNKNLLINFVSDSIGQISFKKNKIKFKYDQTFEFLGSTIVISKTKKFPKHSFNGDFFVKIEDIKKVVSRFLSRYDIKSKSKKSSVLSLSMVGANYTKDIDFLNTLIDVYTKKRLLHKVTSANNTIQFIDNQLIGISDSLIKAEDKLEYFRKDQGIMDMELHSSSSFKMLEQLTEQRANATVDHKYYTYLMDYVKSKDKIDNLVAPSSIGINDPLLTNLISELHALSIERESLKLVAKEQHQGFNVLFSKIQNTKIALLENLTNLVNNSNIKMNDLDSRITKIKNIINTLPSTERSLISINRKFDLNSHIYDFLLQKRAEAGMAKVSTVSDIEILDSADLKQKSPVYPIVGKEILLALFLGVLLPMLFVYSRVVLNQRIQDKMMLQENSEVSIIGSVAHSENMSLLPVLENPKSLISESMRGIRSNLGFVLKQDNAVIGVTSTISGEGKTFCATNLAASLSLIGNKVVLIGADLRKPRLDNNLNLNNNNIGLSTYLSGKSKLDETIYNFSNDLDIIPAGAVPINPAELLTSSLFNDLINDLKKKYTYIIIDTPPIACVSDYISLIPLIDVSLYIVRKGYTPLNSLNYINELQNEKKLQNLYILFNDEDYTSYGTGYGYGYYDEEISKNWLDNILQIFKRNK